jgi:hypothetical protein
LQASTGKAKLKEGRKHTNAAKWKNSRDEDEDEDEDKEEEAFLNTTDHRPQQRLASNEEETGRWNRRRTCMQKKT